MKRKLPLFILLVSLIFIVSMAKAVTARSVNVETGTTITISENTDGALAVSGQDIVVEGDINGALFVAGNSITIKGDVNGPLLVAGNSITIEGVIEGDVFIAGNTIRTLGESELSRDAFIAGSAILIDGIIGRDLFGGSEKVDINNTIGRNAHLYTNTINFSGNGAVGGNMFYQSNNELPNMDQYVGGQVTYEETSQMTEQQVKPQQAIFRRILNIIGALLTALIIWWALRNVTQKRWLTISEKTLNRPIITMLIGLGAILLVPIIVILTFISQVLSGVGFILIIFFILLLFLTRIITASIIGKYILESRFSFNKYNALISFLSAYLLLYLAGMIPIIGGVITFLSLVYAIGLVSSESVNRMQTMPVI